MRQYLALIHRDSGSDFGVSFPDLPGCVTAGRSLEEARDFAQEALALHLAGLEEDGEAAPAPSDLDAIMNDPDHRDGVAVLIAVQDRAWPAVRINITMPEDVLTRVDAFATQRGMNRSGFLTLAAKREMDRAD